MARRRVLWRKAAPYIRLDGMDQSKLERKVVVSLAKLLANESALLERWRIGGKVVGIAGWALVFLSLIAALREPMVERSVVFTGLFGGLFAGLGVWFSSFAAQWPTVSQFIDRPAVERRADEFRV
jgi:hypothetical protein